MNTGQDYYAVLGISRSASDEEIATAYRRLARQWHPDVNKSPGATERFESITKAYEVLKDPKKRQIYDQFGEGAVDEYATSGFDMSNFGDIFSQFFEGGGGNRANARAPVKGADVRIKMRIDFMDAVNGRLVNMPYSHQGKCSACSGRGVVNPSDIQNCPACGGSGVTTKTQTTIMGSFTQKSPCGTCRGTGKKVINPCYRCRGSGLQDIRENLRIKVPAGVSEGSSVKVPGRGKPGRNGGESGDLYIQFLINPSKIYKREGLDLHVDCDVPWVTAVMGGKVTVRGIDGNFALKLKGGVQPSSTGRLKGRGIRSAKGNTGDLVVHFRVKVPTNLSMLERRLYAKLAEIDAKRRR